MWVNLFIAATACLFAFYSVIILMYRNWYLKLKEFKIPADFQPNTTFTIIIPARNESENIVDCINSIEQQDYPSVSFEIIVVDDHSIDDTSQKVMELKKKSLIPIRLIRLVDELDGKLLNAYKKKAIEKAIGYAQHDWIITTDADCTVPKEWLNSYAAFINEKDSVFVAAPVVFRKKNTVLSMFQYIDFVSLQGITAASVSAGFHTMCNGANLGYRKDVFHEVGGFRGIDNIASGDDMLLMNKIKFKYPKKIGYLHSKQALVITAPMPDLASFLNQRIRWASKADKLKDKSILGVLILVYFYNLCLFFMPFAAIFSIKLFIAWLLFLGIKTLIELSFALPVGKFFGQYFLWWFPFLQPMHITYMVVAGWLGKFGTYKWKGRNTK